MAPLTWLVTGCSSGFGECYISSITARGDRVIATARNPEKIAHLQGPNVRVLRLDISSPQEEIDKTVAEALSLFNRIDVLVNNAGYIQGGPVEQVSGENFTRVYRTNLVGTVNVTRALMPHFRSKRSGTVVFTSSISGWQGDVGAGPYCASKFALEGVYETFQKETAPFGIKSFIVEPGYFRTRIFDPENVKVDVRPIEAYTDMNKAMAETLVTVNGNQPGDPKKAVEIVLDVVRGEGRAKGRGMPKRLPLGRDVLAAVRDKCAETLRICDEWEDVICSTDLEQECGGG